VSAFEMAFTGVFWEGWAPSMDATAAMITFILYVEGLGKETGLACGISARYRHGQNWEN
jgi:hypothetical protein